MQNIFTRTSLYDGLYAITTPDDVKRTVPDNPLWLNVEVSLFYIELYIMMKLVAQTLS